MNAEAERAKTITLLDPEAEKAAHTPRRRPDKHLDEHPDERRTFEALEAHITTLKAAVAKAEALGEQHRQEAETASKRVHHLVTELVEMSIRMTEQTAVADRVRAEFDAYRRGRGGGAEHTRPPDRVKGVKHGRSHDQMLVSPEFGGPTALGRLGRPLWLANSDHPPSASVPPHPGRKVIIPLNLRGERCIEHWGL